MKAVLTSLLCVLCLIVVAGCTGSGNSSPFEGSYQGTFSASNDATDNGTVHMNVDGDGNVFGTVTENATGGSAEVRGVIQDNGDFTGSENFSGGSDPFGGNLLFDNQGNLSGPVNVTTSGGVLRETWVLTPVTGKRAKAGAAVPAASKAPIKIATHSIHQH